LLWFVELQRVENELKAIVLAAGKGERLWPLTETRPKPLLPIGNRPILERTLEALVHAGIREVVLVVNYKADMVQKQLGEGANIGCKIEYVKQKSPRGTADAVRSAKQKLDGENKFLVIYGDDYYDKEAVKGFVAKSENNDGITIGTANTKDASQFGKIEVRNGQVKEIREKSSKPGPGLVNSGLYIMSESVIPAIEKTKRSVRGEFELTDSLKILIHQGESVHSEVLEESGWLGLSYPWDLLEANQRVLSLEEVRLDGTVEEGAQLKGCVVLEEGALVKAGSRLEGPVHVGKGCQIGPNAYLRASTCLGDHVKVGTACEVKNSMVMADSKIPHLSYVGDSVIGAECSLGAGTITANLRFDEAVVRSKIKRVWVSSGRRKLGAILGDHVRTGINVSIFPGVKIGQGARLGPGAIVDHDVATSARIRAG
jgi:UDP-N-acetylglucosamine diphosphorylase / glucose-1-phosphate thymidylyltransferase / UDP-N-acetylgalactosamine diphosphorylase / glucosamine-1-phosphate N-acetyltransferase / galactosamine-1-phosphate N-acetyltransferase